MSVPEQKLEPDSNALKVPFDDLGWVGVDPMSEEVVELRENLSENNGIRGLEVVSADEIERATEIFHRDGFVVVRDVLTPEQLAYIQQGCDRDPLDHRHIRTDLQQRPNDDDAGDCIGDAHQRRVQCRRHVPDDHVADEAGENENGEMRHE